MRGLSPVELEQIAKIRRIKNLWKNGKRRVNNISFKIKPSIAELFNNNNNNLYDNEISDMRRILSRLRDILPIKDRKEIKDKLYEIEHQRNISEAEKEKNDEHLRKLVRILNDKEKHSPHDRDDLDYYG